MAESAPTGRRFAMLQAVVQPRMGDVPAKFEETRKSWESPVDVDANIASSKLDGDVKISVVLREAPSKLRDHLLERTQHFECNNNNLRSIIQAYLNSNKSWIANDFRSDVTESDPMEVDHKSKCKNKGKSKSEGRSTSECRRQRQRQKQQHWQKPVKDTKWCVSGKKSHFRRDSWSRADQDKSVNEVEGDDVDADTGIEFVISDVTLSQNGCEGREDGLVMIDSGASVNVCPTWLGKPTLQEADGSIRSRGVDGRTLQDYGKRRLRSGSQTKPYDFHVVDVTKPILCVSYLCENGIETHLIEQSWRHT